MKKLCAALFVIACLLWAPAAHGEDVVKGAIDQALSGIDTSSWQQTANEAGLSIDISAIISNLAHGRPAWDGAALLHALLNIVAERMLGGGVGLALLVAPSLLYALVRQLRSVGGGESVSEAAQYACYLLAAGVLMTQFATQVAGAKTAIDRLGSASERIFPVLMALLAASGSTATVSLLKPAVVASSGVLSALVRTAALSLCSFAAVLAVLGNVTEQVKLSGLFSLARSACNWLLGTMMTVFLAIMSVQGVLAGAYDGVSIRAARYAVDNLVPIVGGEVADTMDVLVKSAALVKNAAGVTGMALLISVCFVPLLQIFVGMASLKIGAALLEPVAEGPVTDCIRAFSSVLTTLFVAVLCSAVLLIVMIGALLVAGGAAAM